MSVASRYLNRELLAIFAVTLMLLLLVAVGGRFISYLQEAALGKFTGATVLTIMGLRLPEFIQQVAPFAAAVAIILTLGRLHAEQEMVVLQGAGMSTAKLLQWVSVTLLSVAVLVALLAGVLTPMAQRNLVDFMAQQRAQTEFETVNAGTFHTYDYGRRVTYSRAMSDDRKVLYDVFMSQKLASGAQVNIWAEQGTQYIDPTGAHFLILNNGRRYESVPGSPQFRSMEFGELRQRLTAAADDDVDLELEALPTSALGAEPRAQAEWHWRVALPLFTIIGGLLAVGIARVKPRQGRFAKVVPGMLLMVVYFLALTVNRKAIIEADIPATMGLWLVHGLFLSIAWYNLSRVAKPVAA